MKYLMIENRFRKEIINPLSRVRYFPHPSFFSEEVDTRSASQALASFNLAIRFSQIVFVVSSSFSPGLLRRVLFLMVGSVLFLIDEGIEVVVAALVAEDKDEVGESVDDWSAEGELVCWSPGKSSGMAEASSSTSSECRPMGTKGKRNVPLLGLGSIPNESHTILYTSVF